MRRTPGKAIYDCKCPECGALHEFAFGHKLRGVEPEPIVFDCDQCARKRMAAIRKVAEAERGEGVI